MARTYNKTEADVRFAHGIGDLVYSGVITTSPTTYTVSWSGLEYFIDGIKYMPSNGSLVLSPSTLGQLLVGDTNGVVSIATSVASTQILISSIDTDGSGVSSQTDAQQGAIVDRVNSSSVEHNSLPGLQGGTTDEYYHLDSSTYNSLINGARNVDTFSVSTYAAGGITVNLATQHLNTNYSISLLPIVNSAYTEDISYNYVITNKTTTSFTVFITKESFGATLSEYVKEELPDGGDGILTDISYITIEESSAIGNNPIVKYNEIQLWSGGSVSPGSSKINGVNTTVFVGASDSDIDFQFQIPTDYTVGRELLLYVSYFIADIPPNEVAADIVVTLFKNGISDVTDPALITKNSIVEDIITLPPVANTSAQHVIQMTNIGGFIGTEQIGHGDLVQVNFNRNTSTVNNSPSDFNLMALGIGY